jgi:hypothetical protein
MRDGPSTPLLKASGFKKRSAFMLWLSRTSLPRHFQARHDLQLVGHAGSRTRRCCSLRHVCEPFGLAS